MILDKSTKSYSLRKSRRILKEAYSLYKRKKNKLTESQKTSLGKQMEELDLALLDKDVEKGSKLAAQLEKDTKRLLPKTTFDFTLELVGALIFALIVAALIRTLWFEPYEIPTGSMRPTFKEQDRVVVSKTNFGINVPFVPGHFLFYPNLMQRTGTFIFTTENMDVTDADTTYFYIFPGKRLLVKRCIAKPGDTIYFYGGKIYGFDKDGNELSELLDSPWTPLGHIPFITFDGKVQSVSSKKSGLLGEFLFSQTGQAIGKLSISNNGGLRGLVFNGQHWVVDQPAAAKTPHSSIITYSDLWGMGNYAMARLLTPEELQKYATSPKDSIDQGLLYMEISHHPSLSYPLPRLGRDEKGQIRPVLTPQLTILPLQQKQLDALMDNLYTARFVVKNGKAIRYSEGKVDSNLFAQGASLPGVPDGTYEFYFGKAYQVNWAGITSELPKDHPLYKRNLSTIQTLFNLGIEFNSYFTPHSAQPAIYPSRYAFFREGAFFVMGAEIFSKDDPLLASFIKREKARESSSSSSQPYLGFIDRGPPLKEGKIDKEFLSTFGLKIPEKMYLALGDNYAMSADSRDFGFVPQDNIRGAPWMILWPPGSRWGAPAQAGYPWFVLPQLIIWAVAALIIAGLILYYRWQAKRPVLGKDWHKIQKTHENHPST